MAEQNRNRILISRIENHFFNPILFLGIIMFLSLVIRLYRFPYDVPLGLDALDYFSYAAKMSQIGWFPSVQGFPNNGWPVFLSVFFSVFHPVGFLDYMELQRFVSLSISVLTIILVYFLCRRFFAPRYSLIGATLFAFEPKIATNSLLGITEPLYIFLGTVTLFLFLSKNHKSIYASFVVCGLFSLIRYEGLLLIISLSIMYFVRFRKEQRIILRYFFAILLFVLVLLPMAYIRIQTTGQDGLVSHFFAGSTYVSEYVIKGASDDDYPITVADGQEKITGFMLRGITVLAEYLVWLTIPSLIIFFGFGLYVIVRDRRYRNLDYRTTTILIFTVTLLLPAFYAYMRGIHEIRYLFIILPVFYLTATYVGKKIDYKAGMLSLFLIIVLVSGFFASMLFLNTEKINYDHEREAFLISEHIVKTPKGINADPIDGNYITTAQVVKGWPIISSASEFSVNRISTSGFNSLEEFIEKSRSNGLTHIIADGSPNRPSYLKDVFYNESRYPYLVKEYDSTDYNFEYHVKMYKIDYDVFDKYVNGKQ